MKITGMILIAIGLIWGIIAFNIDTSVEVGGDVIGVGEYSVHVPKTRVNNIGLMNEKQNHIIGAGLILLIGVLFFIVGTLKKENEQENTRIVKDDETSSKIKQKIPENAIAFYVQDIDDFDTICKQILSKYKKFGFERIVINTTTQFMLQADRDKYIKITLKNNVIYIETKNSPQIDLPILGQRKKYIQEIKKSIETKVTNDIPNNDNVEKLMQLANLFQNELITKEEYEKAKQNILVQISMKEK